MKKVKNSFNQAIPDESTEYYSTEPGKQRINITSHIKQGYE